MIENGISYHDPEIPDSLPTYQYASIGSRHWKQVKSNITVQYEVLEDLFIPDEEKVIVEIPIITPLHSVGVEDKDWSAINALVNEAMRITNNVESVTPMTRAPKWRPSGRITAYDNIVGGAIPLERVRVRARRWFTTHVGYTDKQGYFSCDGRFERPANYSIVWESGRWDIRDGNIVQAYYNGPKITGAWNLYISSGKSVRYATIHRAALRFYYGATSGLTQPQSSRKEKLAYIHGESGKEINGDYNRQWGLGVWSDIRYFGKNSYGWREMSELFSTACHELGHAAHYTNDRNTFGKSKTNLIESWARCVQYTLTNEEYKELRVLNKLNQTEVVRFKDEAGVQKEETWMIPDWQYNFQAWSLGDDRNYTPLFIDLVDDYNQRQYYKLKGYSESFYNKFPDDEIQLPVLIVQDVVFKSKTFADVKINLLNLISTKPSFFAIFGATPVTINQLFETYEN